MLHGLIHRLLIALVVLAGFSPLAMAVDDARADAAQVTVVTPGGNQRALSLDALTGSEDVVGHAYALRSAAGESSVNVTGFSLGAVLEAAGADPFGFSYLEVQRPAGGSVLLSRHQALDPGAFAEGFPVVYATEAGTAFLRPSSGAEDLNADDSFESPQGVTVVLRKDSPLRVRAKASPLRTRPGQPVTFTAIVERAGSGEQLSYSWYFDDGHSGTGPQANHSFAERGSYDVVVGVTTPGDEVGASAVVTVQVGAPIAGPDRKGGGRNDDADAPDHGAAAGTSGAGSPGAGTSATSPAPAPVPTAATAAPVPPKPQLQPPEEVPPTPSGERVSGLLFGEAPPKAPEPTKQAAARSGSLSDDGGSGGLPDATWGLLASAGLLGAGALAEARGGVLLARRGVAP